MTLGRTEQWHTLSASDVIETLESDSTQGLSPAEAVHRLRQLGPNVLLAREGPSALIRFLQQFNHPLIYVLLAAGCVTILLPGHLIDAGVIFGVVLLNAILGHVQETHAKTAIEALSRLVTVETNVVRGGETLRINAADLVPGDLVLLEPGERVPADLRLLRARDLSIDEAMLTGESLPVLKNLVVLPSETPVADRKNMAYSGTLVTSGHGSGVVAATGNETELGHISHLIGRAETLATPLTKKIGRFSVGLTWVILGLACLTFFAGLLHGDPLVDTFLAAVALAVAAIPEGLPAAITIILAIGVTRMAERHAIIRKLPAVETLGSTRIICSDKTGTLTKNEMTVTVIYAGERQFRVTGVGYKPEGIILDQEETPPIEGALREVLIAGALCNDSRLRQEPERWRIEGDPTEGALLVVACKAALNLERLNAEYPRLDLIPFESERQYMATLHHTSEESLIYLKGAIEQVFSRCEHTLDSSGQLVPFDRARANRIAEDLARQGLRVLAFARKPTRIGASILQQEEIADGMTFLGCLGMIDPPRPEAIAAVRACKGAGIIVKMITGDHALTAQTIAHQMGIGSALPGVVTGTDLAQLAERDLPWVAARSDVFARVSPEQKLRLVKAFQAQNYVVAMTGDGVNDAPALKQADIGISMGITGTEVAKEAADMVLADDNFASIEAAVEEGRGVYDNLRKFITWTLPTNGGEGLLVIIAVSLGIALPILPVHLLWINMVTAVMLGMTLAFEPKEPDLMRRPAREPNEPILTQDLLIRIVYVSLLMVIGAYLLYSWELEQGMSVIAARTVVTNVIVLVETAYLFNCRSLSLPVWNLGLFSNRWSILGAALMVLLQLVFVYLSPMQILFQTAPLPMNAWLDAALVAVSIFSAVEVEKWIRRRGVVLWRDRVNDRSSGP